MANRLAPSDDPLSDPPDMADAADWWAAAGNKLMAMRDAERKKSVAMGLLDPKTGLPTPAGWKQIGMAYAQGLGDSGGVGAMGGMIRAYHGSPHMFDRFDMSKIGTGEGAQAYGHGLYFAGNEGVARQYRDALSRPTPGASAGENIAHLMRSANRGDLSAAKKKLQEEINQYERKGWPTEDYSKQYLSAMQLLNEWENRGLTAPGHMYEVNINARPEQLLDWDKPLSAQAPGVRQALTPVLDPYGYGYGLSPESMARTGADFYQQQAHKTMAETARGNIPPAGFNAYEETATALRDAGIPGIQYLDQGSRASGEGTRNYVIFDDKLIDILRRYGILGTTAGAAANRLMGDPQ